MRGPVMGKKAPVEPVSSVVHQKVDLKIGCAQMVDDSPWRSCMRKIFGHHFGARAVFLRNFPLQFGEPIGTPRNNNEVVSALSQHHRKLATKTGTRARDQCKWSRALRGRSAGFHAVLTVSHV